MSGRIPWTHVTDFLGKNSERPVTHNEQQATKSQWYMSAELLSCTCLNQRRYVKRLCTYRSAEPYMHVYITKLMNACLCYKAHIRMFMLPSSNASLPTFTY